MSIDLISTFLSGSVIATFFNAKFSNQSAIHSESEWREDLFTLSKKTLLIEEDIELFRTCLSATRGMPSYSRFQIYYKYDPYLKREMSIDDICIIYYYYLKDKFSKNENIKFLDNSNNDITVFRQLCRLLVKTDWNNRTKNILNCEIPVVL